jgi:hypothetical protein
MATFGTGIFLQRTSYTMMSMDTQELRPVLLDHIQVLQAATSIDLTSKVVHFLIIILLIRDLKFTEDRMAEVMEELPVNTRYEVISTGCCDRGVAFIIQGYKYFH